VEGDKTNYGTIRPLHVGTAEKRRKNSKTAKLRVENRTWDPTEYEAEVRTIVRLSHPYQFIIR
jgi:hypothetical protein